MSYEEHEEELDKCATEFLEDIKADIRKGFIQNLYDLFDI